jgi:hypothetical protein
MDGWIAMMTVAARIMGRWIEIRSVVRTTEFKNRE